MACGNEVLPLSFKPCSASRQKLYHLYQGGQWQGRGARVERLSRPPRAESKLFTEERECQLRGLIRALDGKLVAVEGRECWEARLPLDDEEDAVPSSYRFAN